MAAWTDRAGLAAGALCALHCALAPLALAALPSLSRWLGGDDLHGIHAWIIGSLSLLAVGMTWAGWRRHRRFYAWAFLVPGMLLLWGSLGVHDTTWEHVAMAMGGTLVACAHAVNLRLAHGHVHDSHCRHRP